MSSVKIVLFFLLPLYLFGSDKMVCNYCHGNVFGVSKLQSKEQWRVLTSDGGAALQTIHQENLGVVSYLKSDAYSQTALYNYVSFYADTTDVFKAKQVLQQCKVCHQSTIALSRLWSKGEWKALQNSLVPLKEVHKNELKVVSLIDAIPSKEVLAAFISSVSLHAPKRQNHIRTSLYTKPEHQGIPKQERPQKSLQRVTKRVTVDTNLTKPPKTEIETIKSKTFDFDYDRKKISLVTARKVVRILKGKLKACQERSERIRVFLYQTDSDIYGGDVLLSMVLMGLPPVRYADTWIMEVTKGEEVFHSAVDVITLHGLLSNSVKDDNEYIEDKVAFMIEEIIADPEFGCVRKN